MSARICLWLAVLTVAIDGPSSLLANPCGNVPSICQGPGNANSRIGEKQIIVIRSGFRGPITAGETENGQKNRATRGVARDPDSNTKDVPVAGPRRRPVHLDDQEAFAALKNAHASVSLDDEGRIRQVVFDSRKVTDADLVHLKKASNLRELIFYRSQITDAGIVHLRGLTSLRILSFGGQRWGQRITDKGLLHLHGLTKLERLSIGRTGATSGGIRKLQRALPQCRINQPSNG